MATEGEDSWRGWNKLSGVAPLFTGPTGKKMCLSQLTVALDRRDVLVLYVEVKVTEVWRRASVQDHFVHHLSHKYTRPCCVTPQVLNNNCIVHSNIFSLSQASLILESSTLL